MAHAHEPRRQGKTVSPFAGRPDRPVIIGACPRSGTTLLRTMLHSHPEVAIPRETRFVLEAWHRRRQFGDLREPSSRRALARWIFEGKSSQAARLGLKPEEAIARLVAAPPTLGSLLATCFRLYADKEGKPRWGDKRPLYAARIQAVWDLFPNAHFVNVIRDPRACVASMRKLGWCEANIAPAVELWERSVKTVDSWRRRLAMDQLLDVRFEDLVADPERSLIQIVDFIGVTADADAVESMLRYHEHREPRSKRYHSNVSRPVDAARTSAWTDVLDTAEVAFVEVATRPLMERYGYEPVADAVSPPRQLLRDLARRRIRQAAVRRKIAWDDRLQKRLTYRQPLAAELPRQASGARTMT
jgi:hypothetical protein